MQNKMNRRLFKFDNLKAFLIILVVLGHLSEVFLWIPCIKYIYILIYSFHMPLFTFCSGYFAKPGNKKIKKKIIYPYFIFQVLYLIFDKFALGNKISFTFTTPYWILWYLLSLILWNIFLYYIKEINLKIIIITFLIGLLAGYDNNIGYYLSMSRTIVLLPYFLLGYFCKTREIYFESINDYKSIIRGLGFLSIVIIILVYINKNYIDVGWLYNSVSYASKHYNIIIRLILFCVAVTFSILILFAMPKVKLPIITSVGENSMLVFLLHGFVVRLLNKLFPFKYLSSNIMIGGYLILSTLLITLALSSKYLLIGYNKLLLFKPRLIHGDKSKQ